MTKAELQRELKDLEIRKDVIGNVIGDLRRQYDSLLESILLTKTNIERFEMEERRLRQTTTEKEMKARIAEAAVKRKEEGYRLGTSSDYRPVDLTNGEEDVRPPIPQKTMRLID